MLALSLHVQAGFMIGRLYTPSHNTTCILDIRKDMRFSVGSSF